MLPYFEITDLAHYNKLLKSAANCVREMVGIKTPNQLEKKATDPWWKKRLSGQISELRKDISKLTALLDSKLRSHRMKQRLEEKYKLKNKGLKVVLEELKQRVVVKADKIKRYEKRTNQYQQNRMFDNNQKRLFEKLEGKERSENVIPEKHETNEFWRDIWEKDVTHRMDAEWIEGIETEIDIRTPTQQDISVSIEIIRKQIKKLPNWKSPGPDGIQGYWVKTLLPYNQFWLRC